MITRHLNHQYGPLIIRLFVGIIMLVQHGLPKLIDYNSKKNVFPDPLGISSELSLALVVFAEVICSVFIILGLKTRLSSILSSSLWQLPRSSSTQEIHGASKNCRLST